MLMWARVTERFELLNAGESWVFSSRPVRRVPFLSYEVGLNKGETLSNTLCPSLRRIQILSIPLGSLWSSFISLAVLFLFTSSNGLRR